MDERLAAYTPQIQDRCIEKLQQAYSHGAPYQGKITAKVHKRWNTTALQAEINGLGKIIMVDNAYHPLVPDYLDNKDCKVYGRGTFPWAPWSERDKLLEEYGF